MSETIETTEGTQPNKPVIKPRRGRAFLFNALGLIVILSMVTAYTAAQFTAMGKAFGAFAGTTYAGAALALDHADLTDGVDHVFFPS